MFASYYEHTFVCKAGRLHGMFIHLFFRLLSQNGGRKYRHETFSSIWLYCTAVAGGLTAANKMKVEDLPAAVHKTVNAEKVTATLVGLEKEKEAERRCTRWRPK